MLGRSGGGRPDRGEGSSIAEGLCVKRLERKGKNNRSAVERIKLVKRKEGTQNRDLLMQEVTGETKAK